MNKKHLIHKEFVNSSHGSLWSVQIEGSGLGGLYSSVHPEDIFTKWPKGEFETKFCLSLDFYELKMGDTIMKVGQTNTDPLSYNENERRGFHKVLLCPQNNDIAPILGWLHDYGIHHLVRLDKD